MPRFYIKSERGDETKFQDLPSELKSKIGSFLDPSSKISYLKAVKSVYREPTTPKKTVYHCPFCVTNVWYHDLPMGQQLGQGEDFSFELRNRFESSREVQGADRREYMECNYRRRHYSSKDEEAEISNFFHYFGKSLIKWLKLKWFLWIPNSRIFTIF